MSVPEEPPPPEKLASERLQDEVERLTMQLQAARTPAERAQLFESVRRRKADQRLEARIEKVAAILAEAQQPIEIATAWRELQELVTQRTPERMREMERERRLG